MGLGIGLNPQSETLFLNYLYFFHSIKGNKGIPKFAITPISS